jgi:flagellar hook-associated protein 3 FlgL
LNSWLRDVRDARQRLDLASARAASGRRVERMSDDPAAGAEIMNLEARLAVLGQQRKDASGARTSLTAQTQVLGAVRGLLSQANVLARDVASMSPSDPERQRIADHVQALFDQAVAISNTRVGSDYLFDGGAAAGAPFQSDGTYTGGTGTRRVSVGIGQIAETVVPGDQLASAIGAMAGLEQALRTGDATAVGAASVAGETAEDVLLGAEARVGAAVSRLDAADREAAGEVVKLIERRTAIRDVDPATALIEASAAQTALERAYAVVGKVMSLDLTSLLR